MNTEFDLLNLCAVLGIEAIQKMYDAHMINREQLEHVYYMYKQANKESYAITVKSFNDGNNVYDEIVYIDVKNITDITYKHTQADAVTIGQVFENKDKQTADKIISALNTVMALRKQFKMSTGSLSCMITCLTAEF